MARELAGNSKNANIIERGWSYDYVGICACSLDNLGANLAW